METPELGLASLSLFVAMLLGLEVGRRVGRRERADDAPKEGLGAAESAVFALLGLLVAFTFSGAASRFEARRVLITEEVNAIGTAYLRLDLLPEPSRLEAKELFRRYVLVRGAIYDAMSDEAATARRVAETAELQSRIWTVAVGAARSPEAPGPALVLLVPALNEMFDITTSRIEATRNHPPAIVFWLLAGFCVLGAVLFGHATAKNERRPWLHVVVFASVLALTFHVTLDLEFPRRGLIRVDAADVAFEELASSFR